jgi:hypothetical protein
VNNNSTSLAKSITYKHYLKCHSATQYMRDGRALYCHCGHSYNDHRVGHIGYWYDAIYGKRVVPACTRCNCGEFAAYRTLEYEA